MIEGRTSLLVGDLPDVSAGVPETGGADPPRPIHRTVQKLDATLFQLRAHCVDIVHAERELEPHASVAARQPFLYA